nr:hypothetical protein CFP56_74351 [Quercus suber]
MKLARLVSPTIGLMPTTELKLARYRIEPSVSVPSAIATRFATTGIASPLLDPQGVADKTSKLTDIDLPACTMVNCCEFLKR